MAAGALLIMAALPFITALWLVEPAGADSVSNSPAPGAGPSPPRWRQATRSPRSRLSTDRAMELAVYDISLDFVREMKALDGLKDAGYPNLQTWQLVELKVHGIDGDFIREARGKGHANLSAEELVSLSVRGI